MNDAAPVGCVNCGLEQPFERIYCARCGAPLPGVGKAELNPMVKTALFVLLLSAFVGLGAVGACFGVAFYSSVSGGNFSTFHQLHLLWYVAGPLAAAIFCAWLLYLLAQSKE